MFSLPSPLLAFCPKGTRCRRGFVGSLPPSYNGHHSHRDEVVVIVTSLHDSFRVECVCDEAGVAAGAAVLQAGLQGGNVPMANMPASGQLPQESPNTPATAPVSNVGPPPPPRSPVQV
jgi:hypothetical protein